MIRPDASCTNSPGSYSCACNPGYTSTPPNCVDIDECIVGKNICLYLHND